MTKIKIVLSKEDAQKWLEDYMGDEEFFANDTLEVEIEE